MKESQPENSVKTIEVNVVTHDSDNGNDVFFLSGFNAHSLLANKDGDTPLDSRFKCFSRHSSS